MPESRWARARSVARAGRRRLNSHKPYFASDDVVVGPGAVFGRNVRIMSERVRIGRGTVFRDNVTVFATDFTIGNYCTIYDYCFFPGPGSLEIGHNFWLGTAAIVDCQGGTTIGDNVGVGAHSQLWTHMAHGDTLYGCRFDSVKPLTLHNDVWLAGQCLVSPITAGERSLAMLGSVITRDMQADRTYAGSPARDVTEALGPQFAVRSVLERLRILDERLDALLPNSGERRLVRAVDDETFARLHDDTSLLLLNVESRTYSASGHHLEPRVLRGLLPRAKFKPDREDGPI